MYLCICIYIHVIFLFWKHQGHVKCCMNACRDTAMAEAGGCKLFILGAGLSGRDLSEELRACMVPQDFLPLADIELDFPQVWAAMSAGVLLHATLHV
jgi:hypothetical protein